MNRLRAWISQLSGLFNREELDRELSEEVQSHLEMQIEDNLRAGMTPWEARRQANIRFGGAEQTKESYRERRGIPWLETLWQDIRFGFGMLRKNPGFSATAILTLALGIGANTAIFSVVDTVLLRPLLFKNPSRLVWAWGKFQHGNMAAISTQDFLDYRAQNHSFERLEATVHGNTIFNLVLPGGPVQVESTIVTGGFFQALGIEPLLGRTFLPSDEDVSDPQVAVLSRKLWQERFGADPSVIGKSVIMDGHRRTVLGVLRSDAFFSGVDLWLPAPFRDPEMLTRQAHFLRPIGVLKPGVDLGEAQADVDAIAGRLAHDYADADSGWSLVLVPLQTALVGDVRPTLFVFVGIVALVLFIACVNVASLLLARNSTREKEIAVRMALGAGRMRLVRQMLTESVLLACAGATAGILLASCALQLLRRLGPQGLPRVGEVSISGGVLGITFGVAVLTGILFGAGPALQASRRDRAHRFKEGGAGAGYSRSKGRVHDALVIAEVSLSLIVLVASGLLLKSFWRLIHVYPGFDPSNVATSQIAITTSADTAPSRRIALLEQIQDRIQVVPGVDSAGFISELPLSGQMNDAYFTIPEHPQTNPLVRNVADTRVVSRQYFQTIRMPLLLGRDFTPEDTSDAQPVVLINEPFAEKYFQTENPVGKHLQTLENGPKPVTRQIIGVVGGNKELALQETLRAQMFIPYTHIPALRMNLVIRGSRDPLALASAVREAIRSVDPDEAISAFRSFGDVVSASAASERFNAVLLATLGLIALFLTAVGIFGVLSYLVAQRTHEIGIRVALGAEPHDVLFQILGRGFLLTAIGSAIGLAGAFVLTRLMASLLYSMSATDLTTFVEVVLVLTVVALAACYIPARRAMRVDPMVALRYE